MARMNWTRTVIALAAVLTITTLPAGRPASALLTDDVPLQPGAPMFEASSYTTDGSRCTLNFVFKDRKRKNPRTYIGTAAFCTGYVGSRARSPEVGAFGTVVYRDPPNLFYNDDWDRAAHFALIRIDRNKLKYVSPVVRGFGAAPSGYTRSWETNAGDLLFTHGYPHPIGHPAQAVTRSGVLGGDTTARYWSSMQPNIQDRGSPVVRADGKAVGISDEARSVWGTWLPEAPPVARYATVEGLLRQLRFAGFNVTLA